jgi:hypothetical protein
MENGIHEACSQFLIYFFVLSPLFLSLILPLSHSPSLKEKQRKLPLLSTVQYVQIKGKYP